MKGHGVVRCNDPCGALRSESWPLNVNHAIANGSSPPRSSPPPQKTVHTISSIATTLEKGRVAEEMPQIHKCRCSGQASYLKAHLFTRGV